MRVIGAGRDMHPFHTTATTPGSSLATAGCWKAHQAPGGPRVLGVHASPVPDDTCDPIFAWTGKGMGWDVYGTNRSSRIAAPVVPMTWTSSPGNTAPITAYLPGATAQQSRPHVGEHVLRQPVPRQVRHVAPAQVGFNPGALHPHVALPQRARDRQWRHLPRRHDDHVGDRAARRDDSVTQGACDHEKPIAAIPRVAHGTSAAGLLPSRRRPPPSVTGCGPSRSPWMPSGASVQMPGDTPVCRCGDMPFAAPGPTEPTTCAGSVTVPGPAPTVPPGEGSPPFI